MIVKIKGNNQSFGREMAQNPISIGITPYVATQFAKVWRRLHLNPRVSIIGTHIPNRKYIMIANRKAHLPSKIPLEIGK
jgi:hypothetical protein